MGSQSSVGIDSCLPLAEIKSRGPEFVDRLHLSRGNPAPYPNEFAFRVQLGADTVDIHVREYDGEFPKDPINVMTGHLVRMRIEGVRLCVRRQYHAVPVNNVGALPLTELAAVGRSLHRPSVENDRRQLGCKHKECKAQHQSAKANPSLTGKFRFRRSQSAAHSCLGQA